MISAVNTEKMGLEQQKISIFTEIGRMAYQSHQAGEDMGNLQQFFEQIQETEGRIGEKDQKIAEIATRYDEEISLLTATLNSITTAQASMANQGVPVAPVMPVGGGAFCENCGRQAGVGDAFCQGCGSPMSR